ncbi:MAG: helix-turn-helix domain-containing protein [Flavobacteriaceae bacterium]|nr:helix-turn-helix domain-containing protein [Flavobacteriaceae bacterium]
MNIADNLKVFREQKGLLQKEVANAVGVHPSNYSKMEKGERDVSIEVADKLAKFFGVTIDELVHMTNQVPDEITIVDKSVSERINLIQQLEEEDKKAIYRIIDSMLTKSKFKDFFNKNVASL